MRQREIVSLHRRAITSIDLSAEAVQRYIDVCQCPYCKNGKTYKMLPLHVYQIHGVTAYDFRKLYGWNRHHRLISDGTHSIMSVKGKIKAKENKAFMSYDRHLSSASRYKDGGKRAEAIRADKLASSRPDRIVKFKAAIAHVDRKAIALKVPLEQRIANAKKGGIAWRQKVPKWKQKEIMAKARMALTPELIKIRITHAQETMNKRYRSNPFWVTKWRESVAKGAQKHAKVNYEQRMEIKKLVGEGFSRSTVAQKFGICRSRVGQIVQDWGR